MSSVLDKTEAVVLRVIPFSETSTIAICLTRDRGRLVAMLKGSQRPKSAFLGQCDLFYTCELVYYRQDRSDLMTARECAALNARTRLRNDWRAYVCASAVCAIVQRAAVSGSGDAALFDLTVRTLDHLAEHGATPSVIPWFECRFAQALGLAPRLDACSVCRGSIPAGVRAGFSSDRGGVVCPACLPGVTTATLPLPPDCLAILKRLLSAAAPETAAAIRYSGNQRLVICRILGSFLRFHLGVDLGEREIALELLNGWPQGMQAPPAPERERRAR